MPVDQKSIPVDQLQKGMYISKLDRPWIETPFPLQGFYVRDLKDIDLLRRFCREVWIDIARSRVEVPAVVHAADPASASDTTASGHALDGFVAEAWTHLSTVLTLAQRNAIHANHSAYYGTP